MAPDRPHVSDLSDRLLDGLVPEARRAIVSKALRRAFQSSQVLCRAGDPADRLFVLRTGRVRFFRLSGTGREVVMGILGPGDVFGLGSMLVARMDYIGTAQALERGEVFFWTRDVIQRLADEYPRLAGNALHVALTYLARFAARHERLLSNSAEQRLAHALMRLGSRGGVPSASTVEVRIKNEELASLADVSPFTASRLLKDWERGGAVSKSRGAVQIICPEKLLLG